MKSGMAIIIGSYLLLFPLTQTLAAVQLASPEQDRYAKQAVPPSGKALIYVYRAKDGNTNVEPGVWLNKRNSGQLEPGTYGMWAASPGRLEIRAGRANATPLSLNCEAGRIYFVQLAISKDGSETLQQVPYGTGRKGISQARLALDPSFAARREPAPAKKVSPAVRAAPPAISVAKKPKDQQQSAVEGDTSGVGLIFKVGSFQLATGTQAILLLDRNFSATDVAYGVEGEWRLRNGLAFGLEVFGHTQEYTTTASIESGELAVTSFFINTKKYFRSGKIVQPYIGAGIGSAAAEFSSGAGGGITGNAGGFAVQGLTGLAFHWRHVGIYTELKYVNAEIGDAAGQSVDVSGTGIFAGMSVRF